MNAERIDPLELLKVDELAALWHVHPKTVREWIATGELPSVLLGRARRVPRVAAEEFQRSRLTADDATVSNVKPLRKGQR